jgi:hypothetical protein
LKPLTNFTTPANILLQPQVSNEDDVVYRDNQGNIQVVNFDTTLPSPQPIASGCTNETQRPGISKDGQFAAFAATCSPAGTPVAGIWLAQKINNNWTFLGPVWTAGADFTAFNLTTRVGIASTLRADQSFSLEIVFGATAPPTPGASPANGIYKITAYAGPVAGTLYVEKAPRRIISVGDTLNGKTVSQYDLWDPISKSGVWVGMSLGFTDGSQAIARALAP